MAPPKGTKLTPMLQHFFATKQKYPDAILFYRMGDFYEMFDQDAVAASKVLQIQLTARGKGTENQVPMCGIPVHAYQTYVNKLTHAGLKVAICEQVEDPAEAKGLVKREVIRVITPGTILAEDLLDPTQNHFLMALHFDAQTSQMSLAVADLSTGEVEVEQFSTTEPLATLSERLLFYRPKELVHNSGSTASELTTPKIKGLCGRTVHLEAWGAESFELDQAKQTLKGQFEAKDLKPLNKTPGILQVTGALFDYLNHTQKESLIHFTQIHRAGGQSHMTLDEATVQNLELFDSQAGPDEDHSLMGLLNHCQTPMGSRLLRRWISMPLIKAPLIENRLEAVQTLIDQGSVNTGLREDLKSVGDLERILTRISLSGCAPNDLLRLKKSLIPLEAIKPKLLALKTTELVQITDQFDSLADLYLLLETTISDQTGLKLSDGGVIATGFDEQLDQFRGLAKDGKQLIANLEAKVKRETGINTLKIGYNRVFGYYFEVSKASKGQVPESFIRKQTLASSERYATEELAELEEQILSADDQAKALEARIFEELRQKVRCQIGRIQGMSKLLARLDVYGNFAFLARSRNYHRPQFLSGPQQIELTGARHPVVEAIQTDSPFIANDLSLTAQGDWIHIITGPNMGGKSTYMRQTALIALMAQIGCFVPAKVAKLSVFDRIFTRVGASDNLTRGQSTFMVEMSEAASILSAATNRSLVILDEIGRGTSTLDGISLAWSIIEYLQEIKSLTLFATHYHELIRLEGQLEGVSNAKVVVKEEGDKIVFLKKVSPGPADRSYGIHVAELAGLPNQVIDGAKRILGVLENSQEQLTDPLYTRTPKEAPSRAPIETDNQQITFESQTQPWVEELRSFDLMGSTPLEAMQFLSQLQQKL